MLYRVVTHTIKEEMVDQPPSAFQGETAPSGGYWYPTGPTGPMPAPMPSNRGIPGTNAIYTTSIYNTESAVEFRMSARTIWARYLWRMRSYIVSALNGGEDLTFVEEQLFKDIDDIGDMVKPYYGLVASKQVSQLMHAFVLTEIDIVRALRNRQDIKNLQARHIQQVEDFATFLHSANPKHWPKEAVIGIFADLLTCWQNEAIARAKKDWATDIKSTDDAHRVVLAGQENGTPPFTEVFAKGVIAQFPDRFID